MVDEAIKEKYSRAQIINAVEGAVAKALATVPADTKTKPNDKVKVMKATAEGLKKLEGAMEEHGLRDTCELLPHSKGITVRFAGSKSCIAQPLLDCNHLKLHSGWASMMLPS